MKISVLGMAVLTAAAVGGLTSVSQAAPKKVAVPVISGAKALSIYEKGGVTGMGRKVADPCIPVPDPCTPPPPPPSCEPELPSSIVAPDPCAPPPPPNCAPADSKPGYGFGTSGHFGPPGQGFTPANSWRGVVAGGGRFTPKGRALPPRAFR